MGEREGHRPELGDLEATVLGVIRRLGRASARDVLRQLMNEKDLAYTTVSTTLNRLYNKGILKRKERWGRGGKTYVFSPVEDAGIARRAVDRMVEKLVQAFGPAIVSQLHEKLQEMPREDLEELKSKVKRLRRHQHGSR